MNTPTDNTARQEWLINTLYALRAHFRDQAPTPENKDLRSLDSGRQGFVYQCVDGRLDLADMKFEPGEYYNLTELGAAHHRTDAGARNFALEAKLQRALLQKKLPEAPDWPLAGIIMGHETCGANDTLLNAKLGNPTPDDRLAEKEYMNPMASDALEKAIQGAQHVNHDFLHEQVTQYTVLTTMKNLYREKVGNTSVQELVDSGQAQIIGAVRGLAKKDGTFPLAVYDPLHADFLSIEALYDEAFPRNNHRSAEAIESRLKRRTAFIGNSRPKTHDCAHHFMEDIEAGLAMKVNRIADAGKDPTALAVNS